MFKKNKGKFGYLHRQAIVQGVITLALFLLSAGLFLTGYLISKDTKNILTIVAVLGMLPAAKSVVSMIMYMKAEKYSCSEKLKKTMEEKGFLSERDTDFYAFDLYLTSYDKNFALAFAYVKKGCLIAITEQEKCDCQAAEKHIKHYFEKNAITNITIKIFHDEKPFFERMEQLSSSKEENDENELKAIVLMKNLSL